LSGELIRIANKLTKEKKKYPNPTSIAGLSLLQSICLYLSLSICIHSRNATDRQKAYVRMYVCTHLYVCMYMKFLTSTCMIRGTHGRRSRHKRCKPGRVHRAHVRGTQVSVCRKVLLMCIVMCVVVARRPKCVCVHTHTCELRVRSNSKAPNMCMVHTHT
jgi:hypothetical protein